MLGLFGYLFGCSRVRYGEGRENGLCSDGDEVLQASGLLVTDEDG